MIIIPSEHPKLIIFVWAWYPSPDEWPWPEQGGHLRSRGRCRDRHAGSASPIRGALAARSLSSRGGGGAEPPRGHAVMPAESVAAPRGPPGGLRTSTSLPLPAIPALPPRRRSGGGEVGGGDGIVATSSRAQSSFPSLPCGALKSRCRPVSRVAGRWGMAVAPRLPAPTVPIHTCRPLLPLSVPRVPAPPRSSLRRRRAERARYVAPALARVTPVA